MRDNIIIAIILALIAISTAACINLEYEGPTTVPDQKSTEMYEITEVDVFSIIDEIDSRNIMVMGIKLGDPMADVLTKVGTPDIQTQVGPNSFNYEYRERLLADHVALLFHSDNGTVTRITLRPEFNRYLHGKTAIQNITKSDMFAMFGLPDVSEPVSYFTIYYFYEIGFETVVDAKYMAGFSLVPPKPGIRDEKVIVS